jgi:hypothetical protein
MKESITIVLPLPPKVLSSNFVAGSIGGRMMKASATKKYRRIAKEAVESENVESAPWKKASVKATFHFPDSRRRDQRNFESMLKAAYDGIVDSGIVPDDDYNHFRGESTEFLLDKVAPGVILEITRIE